MNEWGKSCFPSTRRQAEETGLSERAVCTHLEKAHKLGWLVKKNRGLRGRLWQANEYEAAIPEGARIKTFEHEDDAKYDQGTTQKSTEPRSVSVPISTEPSSALTQKSTEPNAESTEPNDTHVLNEVQCSTSVSTSKSTSYISRVNILMGKLVQLYNQHLKHLPPVQQIRPGSPRYLQLIKIFEMEDRNKKEDFWDWYFSGVKELPHYNGSGETGTDWKPTFGWLIDDKNFDDMVDRVLALETADA